MNLQNTAHPSLGGRSGDMGSNQSDLRDRNERLVLTILRRSGPLPKAELARRTGLSAQTVSVIIRDLETRGLLEKGKKLRGKVGQPSVPMELSRTGAFFLGLKVGRRSAELILVNFVGEELGHVSRSYNYPTPPRTLEFVKEAVEELCITLSEAEKARIAGLGVATPYFLWEWASVIGVPPEDMAAWKGFDLQKEIAEMFDFPVYLGNDATSACGAELTFGTAEIPSDFLYIYIGYFVGGGIVLNGRLYSGRLGNAGAIGTFPLQGDNSTVTQLVDTASLIGLERRLARSQGNPTLALDPNVELHLTEPTAVAQWLNEVAPTLALLIVGACSIIDFPTIVIDGNMPKTMCERVAQRVSEEFQLLPNSGIIHPEIVTGSLGPRARTLGAASLALSKNFMLES